MKTRFVNLFWFGILLLVLAGFIYAFMPSRPNTSGQKLLAETRQSLRDEGFKTDMSDFDFFTSPEMQMRENILKATAPGRVSRTSLVEINLMEIVGNDSAVVVGKQASVELQYRRWPDNSDEMSWDNFRQTLGENQPALDVACDAILAGTIAFNLDARSGNAMLLPHLAMLKQFTQMLDNRMVLALHDGNTGLAFTNLLAATRLTTAWNPEPVEISHLVRFANAKNVFAATWQALQTNHWTDEQLSRLQAEWESANFFTNLSEIIAFERASTIAAYNYDRAKIQHPSLPFSEFFRESWLNPLNFWSEYKSISLRKIYQQGGMYDEEKDVLLFYRDREVERRNAVLATTWLQMRQLPGVTNEIFFQSKYNSRLQTLQNLRRIRMTFQTRGPSFLGRAAEAEVERRILITAIALERYLNQYGHYPQTLAALTPEFLKTPFSDFMDGQPLRYRLRDERFLLYSVGFDGVDDGGKFPAWSKDAEDWQIKSGRVRLAGADILWPLPATSAQIRTQREQQSQAQAKRMALAEANEKIQLQHEEQMAERARQATVKKLLAKNPLLGEEPVYQGKPLSVWVIKLGSDELNGAPADAIAAIRSIGSNAVPYLLEWMPHPGVEKPVEGFPNWSDVEIAWWALGTEGKSAIPTLAHLISLPQKTMDDYSVWTENAEAISYLGPEAIVPMLTVATNMQGRHELWELLHNFGNLGTNGEAAVPALIHWANDPDYWVRDGVVSALGGIGKRPDLAVPVLMKTLEHESNSMVRRDTADALGSFANDSAAAFPELTNMLKDSNWEVRGGALSGLGKITNKPDAVVPLIVPFLYDDNNVIQRSAAYALRDLGSEAGYRALLQATNASGSGIGDIIYQVQQKMNHAKLQ